MALFPTTVVGSLPRPEWLRELILDRKDGRISPIPVDEAYLKLKAMCSAAGQLRERHPA